MICFHSDLDKECIEALGEALDTWGGKDGAILVISHDRSFCEKVGFTHVATVAEGTLKIEQRSLCEDDWEQYSLKSDCIAVNDEQNKVRNAQQLEEEKRELAKRRKLSVNAPRRIAQLEKLISDSEVVINSIDAEALANGKDVGKLVELTKAREREQAKVDEMMKEWEELEAIVAEFS
jgi:ATPase subunit of ABC transporter with duplicated ATPase domains